MTKAELIAQIAAQAQLPKAEAEKIFNALIKGITSILQAQGKLNLLGLGVFSVQDRPARTGRNPQTGAPIEIAASKAVKFKPGKTLREAVR
jgi:DNA-binding protein HU-beta